MKKLIKLVAILLVSAQATACGFEIVDTGKRGVETSMGKVVSESLPEGLYFYNPLTSNIIEMDTRVLSQAGLTEAYTKDLQQAKLEFKINYNLEKTKVHIVYQEVGEDWEEKLVPQVIVGSLKEVIGKWTAEELISNRDKVLAQIGERVKNNLAAQNVNVTNIELTNITYSNSFENAIESKVVAIQKAQESENKTKQIQEEAKQKVISAEAEAKSMQIRSQALAQSQSLVEYEAVQKWDGKLPQYMLGNSTPFINLTK